MQGNEENVGPQDHRAKIKGNEGPQRQNERKYKAKIKDMKAQKAKNCKMGPALALIHSFCISQENGPFLATCGGGARSGPLKGQNASK